MNKEISNIIIFAVGAAIGSAVTWKFVKNKYSKIADEEISSVKETFAKRAIKETQVDKASEDREELKNIVSENGYLPDEESNKKGGSTVVDAPYVIPPEVDAPYVIPPDEFGEYLVDEEDEPIEDVESIVGVESLDHFGEWEDDAVHVRNDRLKTDYEILLDPGYYNAKNTR